MVHKPSPSDPFGFVGMCVVKGKRKILYVRVPDQKGKCG